MVNPVVLLMATLDGRSVCVDTKLMSFAEFVKSSDKRFAMDCVGPAPSDGAAVDAELFHSVATKYNPELAE